MSGLRVAHYINQFFGGIGGEDKADVAPFTHCGPVGPGVLLDKLLGEAGRLVLTVVCGDNYFAADAGKARREVLDLLKRHGIDLVIAGPAFNAGRYGIACGEVCQGVAEELGVAAVTGMFAENPGVDLYRRSVFIVQTQSSAAGMAKALPGMVALGLKLAAGERVTKPALQGCFPRGVKSNYVSDRLAADRAIDLLCLKLQGEPFVTEIAASSGQEHVPAAPPIVDLAEATIALVTEGGLVPLDNPDRLESAKATRFASYVLTDLETLGAAGFHSIHRGFDTKHVNEDPMRLLPVDAAREAEQSGRFKRLFPRYLVTTGVATPIKNAEAIGKGIAEELLGGGVSGVILTST